MVTATWNGVVIAESNNTVVVDGNHYFPAEALKREHFQESSHTTSCGWKGVANYYDVVADGAVNEQAAWYYPAPKDAAKAIAGGVAFWKGIEVSGTPSSADPEIAEGACEL